MEHFGGTTVFMLVGKKSSNISSLVIFTHGRDEIRGCFKKILVIFCNHNFL